MAETRELTLRFGQLMFGDPENGIPITVVRRGQKVAVTDEQVEQFGVDAFEETYAEWLEQHPDERPPEPPTSEIGFTAEGGGEGVVGEDEGNQILAMDEDQVKQFVKTQGIEQIVAAVNENPKAAYIVLEMEEETSAGDVRKGLATRLGPLADQYDPDEDINEPPPLEDEE